MSPTDNDGSICDQLAAIQTRTGVSEFTLATMAGVAPQTWKHALAIRKLPPRNDTRRRMVRFARANREAKAREELRMLPEAQ